MGTDSDLAAVRELRAGPAEPTDLAVARVRARVMARPDRSTVNGRRTWFAVASAAVAVVAVVGLVVAIQGVRDRSDPGFGAGPAPSKPAVSVVPVPPGVTPGPAVSLVPMPALDSVTTPLVFASGQLLYARETSPAGAVLTEAWVDPEGGIELLRLDVYGMRFQPTADEVAQVKADLQLSGPSLNRPTPAYLQALPTDPATLYTRIADQFGRSGDGTMRADLVFKNSLHLLLLGEPLLSPATRDAYLQALARTPGATIDRTPRTFAGRAVYLVQQRSDFGLAGFIVDTTTGRIIGGYATGVAGDPLAEQAQHWEYAVVGAAGQRP